jgi:hypothetical protein
MGNGLCLLSKIGAREKRSNGLCEVWFPFSSEKVVLEWLQQVIPVLRSGRIERRLRNTWLEKTVTKHLGLEKYIAHFNRSSHSDNK